MPPVEDTIIYRSDETTTLFNLMCTCRGLYEVLQPIFLAIAKRYMIPRRFGPRQGVGVAFWAAEHNRLPLLRFLIEQEEVESEGQEGDDDEMKNRNDSPISHDGLSCWVPMFAAIKSGHVDAVRYLHTRKGHANIHCMHVAVVFNQLAVVEALLEMGYGVDEPATHHHRLNHYQRFDRGVTPLMKAKGAEMTRLLLKHGANVNYVAEKEEPPFSVLSWVMNERAHGGWDNQPRVDDGDLVETIRLLLKAGADPRWAWADGRTSVRMHLFLRDTGWGGLFYGYNLWPGRGDMGTSGRGEG